MYEAEVNIKEIPNCTFWIKRPNGLELTDCTKVTGRNNKDNKYFAVIIKPVLHTDLIGELYTNDLTDRDLIMLSVSGTHYVKG